ncbi:MAG: hypothetical protein ACOWWR_16400 [Eubacteriales bacterium]
MDTCIYCGNKIKDKPEKVKVLNRKFPVCSQGCSEKTIKYVAFDKKYKKIMYLGIFIPAVIMLVNLVMNQGMALVYIMQTLVGIMFLLFPYPNVRFETFNSVSIRGVTWICRVIGIILLVLGVCLFFMT